uniref:GPI-anchored protein pfl2 isoform X3 n=1 Tax=Diabrotica virgifera virgifera TaxID=50390 RepID=A0A6P7H073_DIAVI
MEQFEVVFLLQNKVLESINLAVTLLQSKNMDHQILEKDVISRKICANCSKVVVKMNEFRERSIRTDKYLKEKCIEHLKATKMKIPNTNITITTRKLPRKEKIDDSNDNDNHCQNELDESKKCESFQEKCIEHSRAMKMKIPNSNVTITARKLPRKEKLDDSNNDNDNHCQNELDESKKCENFQEKCIEHSRATKMKIPNSNVTITARKLPRKEKLDDSNNDDDNHCQNELDESKKCENFQEKCIEHSRAMKMKIPNSNVTITARKLPRKEKLDDSNNDNDNHCQNKLNESKKGESCQEKCIKHLTATKMKIPNTNVTITTKKLLRKEKLDDCNNNNDNLCQNESDESKKEENNRYSHNASIPRKVSVHKSVSELFLRHPNLKLRTDVLAFDVSPCVSLELDEVEKYCNDNNINLKLATERATRVNTARKKTTALNNKNISNWNSSSEANTSKDKIISPNNPENAQAPLKVSPISIRLGEDRNNFKVTPISIKLADDRAKFKIISDSSKRKRESSENTETITVTKQSKIKRRRLSSSDFTSDKDQTNPTLFETLGLKPSQPSSEQTNTYKCNICLSVQKNAKALKHHYREHFCCSFCKTRFRLVERRISHEKKCTVRHALNSKPYVKLTRVELINKYPLHSGNSVINKNSVDCNEVIVLSDDDEPVIKSTNVSNVSNSLVSKSNSGVLLGITHAQNSRSKVSRPEKQIKTANAVSVVTTESSSIEKGTNDGEAELGKITTYSPAKSNTFPKPPATVGTNDVLPQTDVSSNNAEVPPVQYSSTAIVRPDVKIKEDTLLNANNLNGSDITLLKELLKHAKGVESKSLKEPTPEDISRNGTMKNMFLQLALYRVPVNIRHGQHSVTFSKAETEINKEVTMWDDINPLSLLNRNANMDITNVSLNPSETVLVNSGQTNNPATLQRSVPVPVILNSAVSRMHQTLGIMLTPNTQYSKTHSSSQAQTIISSPNTPSQSSVTVTSPNGVRTVFSQSFTPNFLNNSNAHLLNSTNNTSPQNSNASSQQILPRTLNNEIVNNATNSSQKEFIPISNTSINSTNGVSHVFRSPGDLRTVVIDGKSVVIDSNIIGYQRLRGAPTQSNMQFIYSNSNNRQIAAPLLNNQRVILNATVANCTTTQNTVTSNNIQQNILNTTSLIPNTNISNNFSNFSVPQTPVVPPAPLLNNQCVILNATVANGNTTPSTGTSNDIQQNTLNTTSLIPNTNTSNNFSNFSVPQTPVVPPAPLLNNQCVILNATVANGNTTPSTVTSNDIQQNTLNTISLIPNTNTSHNFNTFRVPQTPVVPPAPLLNNQCVILNATVANGNTTPSTGTSNDIQQNTLNTTSLIPNTNTSNNFNTFRVPQTPVVPNNLTYSKPMIRVKNICDLK